MIRAATASLSSQRSAVCHGAGVASGCRRSRGDRLAVIELGGVTRRFGALTAVDDVSLTVDDGQVVGLLGHNGAGKTTLIRVINGLLPADAGEVRVLGRDPSTDGPAVRSSTGVLTEYPALDQYLSVRENLEVYAAINGVERRQAGARIDELLDRLGLVDKARVLARDLSAGLKQRVAVARSLVHDPQLLLLDEPTTNMDPVAARHVRELIMDSVRARGRTVLLSTHNLPEAEAICDRIAIMRNGRLLRVGPPKELRRDLGGARGALIGLAPGMSLAALSALGLGRNGHVIDDATIQVGGDVTVPVVVKQLVESGLEVHRVEPLDPTLEDLYVHLHGEQVTPGRDTDGGSS
jgi:ABC-2 type transport system ATP-binding protein